MLYNNINYGIQRLKHSVEIVIIPIVAVIFVFTDYFQVVENLRRTEGQSSAAEAKLVGASTARLQDMCSSHNEPKKVYCRTDQQCICMLCAMDHHKGHDTVSALAERTDKLVGP